MAETLHDLAALAIQAPPVPDTLCLAAQTLRLGAGLEETHVICAPAEESCWASDPPADEKPLANGGLGFLQRRLVFLDLPLAFDIGAERRIEGLCPARDARGRPWAALAIPGRTDISSTLLVRGDWPGPIPDQTLQLLEASLPSFTVLLGRCLDASQATRQREQLNTLSEVARAITQTREMEAVLTHLANTIAAATGWELVILDVLAEDGRSLRFRCFNQSRWSEGPQAAIWREWGLTSELPPPLIEDMRLHRPALFSSLQRDERVGSAHQDFWRRSLLVSAGIFPLCFGDEGLGFLTVASFRPHDFPAEDVQLLEGLAAQAAAAVKAVKDYEELEASREQLQEYAERLRESMDIQHRLARTDALTSIPNRRYVEEFLTAQCARSQREGSPLSVILADVDNFKKVNDNLGHRSGDQVLISLAGLAQSTCRAMDVVGRYGGDEFIFVLPLADLGQAADFAERFRSRVASEPLPLTPKTAARVTVSLGAALFGNARADPETLLQAADEALYRAKAQGKNQVCVVEERVTAA